MIEHADAMHHEHRHLVSNIVGDREMRIEIGAPVDLAPRDTVLIASDGLSDNLTIEELVDLVRKGPLKSTAGQLATRCIDRMTGSSPTKPSKPDDVTFIVFRQGRSD